MDFWLARDEMAVFEQRGDPIVLLHGLCGCPRMLRPLGRFLRRDLGRPTLAVALGIGLEDIRDQALRVHELLAENEVSTCDVVGYSMGGLVAAYLLKCLDQGRSIRRAITLGTPHRGVPLMSRWPALLAGCCRSAAQMRSGSTFIEHLVRLPEPGGTLMLSIAGADDRLVPPEAARLYGPRPRNLVLPGIDHWRLLTSRRVYAMAARFLRPRHVQLERPLDAALGLPLVKAEGDAGPGLGEATLRAS